MGRNAVRGRRGRPCWELWYQVAVTLEPPGRHPSRGAAASIFLDTRRWCLPSPRAVSGGQGWEAWSQGVRCGRPGRRGPARRCERWGLLPGCRPPLPKLYSLPFISSQAPMAARPLLLLQVSRGTARRRHGAPSQCEAGRWQILAQMRWRWPWSSLWHVDLRRRLTMEVSVDAAIRVEAVAIVVC
jgi:hypothetical protein